MIFNSFNFIIIFPLIFLLYYTIPEKNPKVRNIFLLFVSYLLYIQWKPVYALVLLGVTIITYYAALLIQRIDQKKLTLILGILASLMPLVLFKYSHFINTNLGELLSVFGLNFHLTGLNWAIPVGISFFTFQAIGYLCDVYYTRHRAECNFITYALFLSFFPCILAGPINKASLVIPQLNKMRTYFDYEKAIEGLKLLLWGMFMKVVVADRVALYINTVLDNYMNYTGTSCIVACLLYSIQIYADFAGYSFMAIGVGKTLGFEFSENFRRPCFAFSVSDFWRRWHISLSTWLRYCVYIPLGGSRCSKLCNYRNLLLTFMVSGIWHGANWTYIVWGSIHGFCLIIEKITGQHKCEYGWKGRFIKIVLTFLVVTFSRIFFRMPTLTDACSLISRMFDPTLPLSVYVDKIPNLPFSVLGIGILLLKDFRDEFIPDRFPLMNHKCRYIRWSVYISLLFMILTTGVFGSDQFIYANF